MTTTDLHRIVGEYLSDDQLWIAAFSAQSHSVSLSVVDVDSVRYAHTLTTPDRCSYIGNIPFDDDQLVNVTFVRADGVYVSVTHRVTDRADRALVARLRALGEHPGAARLLAVLAEATADGPDESEAA